MNPSSVRLSPRLLLIAVCVICSTVLAIAAGKMGAAAHLANTHNPADWARAAKIEPGNSAYWNQLGLYQEWNFTHGNIQQAVRDFQRATQLNPRLALLWTNLASAYEVSGQTKLARQAYEKAQSARPVSAEVAWQFGSFLLRQGETRQAARQIRRALVNKPTLVPSAISQFTNAGVGLDQILETVLPARPQDYLAALNFFVSRHHYDGALASWDRLASVEPKVPLDDSLSLINGLIALHRWQDAERVWRQVLSLDGLGNQAGTEGSLIFNGGFERNLVNGGFGWLWIPAYGVSLDLVGNVKHGGAQSARVTFDGTANVNFSNLRQSVSIRPGQRYRFSAYVRTDRISTDSGPQFVVSNCTDPFRPLAQTPAMTGTHPWTKVEATFTAGADMQCAEIMLKRAPSQMFENKILGMVWVDDVRLVPAPASGGRSQ